MRGPAQNTYDVIVIGIGSVGYTVAARARAAGLTVAVVERELVGGKKLIHSATIAVAGQVPVSRLWHAVPCFPSISEAWLRLLEAYRS